MRNRPLPPVTPRNAAIAVALFITSIITFLPLVVFASIVT